MDATKIPFNRPALLGREMQYITQAILQGHAAGDGAFTKKCQKILECSVGVPKALLTTSCTHALEMCGLLLNIQPGDEVIVPSYTFVTTANAFALRGAKLVFADISPDTLNINPEHVRALITPRTRAIVVVHYAGVACDMDVLVSLAREAGVALVEDNAHGLYGKYRGRFLGTFGTFSTQSFHETKNLSCGEGGALLINDPRFEETAEIIREKGTNRSRFFRGQVDKYTWVGLGSSYVMSDILAAFLLAQLEARNQIMAQRKAAWERYLAALSAWGVDGGIGLPHVPAGCEQTFHMFYLLMPSLAERQAFIAHLASRGVMAVFHYHPLHLSPFGQQYGGKLGDCPVSEDISDRLVRLPLYNDLNSTDQDRVVDAVLEFQGTVAPAISTGWT